MSIVVVGTVAFDTVETPFGRGENVLGGSATYFSTSASFFTDVSLVAVVGEDFPEEHVNFLKSRDIDTTGLSRIPGKTFHWSGRYGYDLNEAQTLDTQLNVLMEFRPNLPESYRDAEYLFLANIDPDLQLEVLSQVRKPRLVACDTMNFWISSKPEALREVLRKVDIGVINEGEARQFTGEANRGPGVQASGGQTGGVRGSHVHRRFALCRAGLPAGGGFRPHRSGRYLRRGVHGVPGQHGKHFR
jgi:sugar/nucleoside kinase (ribokinase family)